MTMVTSDPDHDPAGLADDKRGVSASVMMGTLGRAEPEVNRSHGAAAMAWVALLRLLEVTGVDDGHVGQHLHHADILEDLVGGPVFSEGESAVRGADLDVLCRCRRRFVGFGRRPGPVEKLAKVPVKGMMPADGQASRHANHVGFGDAGLLEPVGERVLKGVHFEGAGEVGTQGHDPVVGLAHFE